MQSTEPWVVLPGTAPDQRAIALLRTQADAVERLRRRVLDELPALAPPDVVHGWRSTAADRCSERLRDLTADAHRIGEYLHDTSLALLRRIDELEAQLELQRAEAALAAAGAVAPLSDRWRWTSS